MLKKRILAAAFIAMAALMPKDAGATKLLGVKVVDKDYLMVHFRDGEVRYRDDATGPSAYLGHSFAEGDDTLLVFGTRLDPAVASNAAAWTIASKDDKSFGTRRPLAAWR